MRLEVRKLRKSYGDREVLHDVDLTAREGTLTVLLGPNGAGKTTTLRCICGILIPDDGTVLLDGADVRADRQRARKAMGYLPEESHVYDDMAPLEYLRFFGRLLGMGGTDLEARAEDLDREYGLQGHAELPARALSKGLRRRLELARTLLPDPPVLILDEPASGLDPSSSVALNQELLSLKRERTVLVSTHLLLDADRLCDDVVIMNEGRVVTAGPKDVLKEALAAERRYVLEVLGKEPTGKDLEIEGLPGDRWQVVYRGTPAGFAALTGRLSRSGEVVRVSVEEPGLDDVFFREIGGVDAPSP